MTESINMYIAKSKQEREHYNLVTIMLNCKLELDKIAKLYYTDCNS